MFILIIIKIIQRPAFAPLSHGYTIKAIHLNLQGMQTGYAKRILHHKQVNTRSKIGRKNREIYLHILPNH
jgi:hypothetical protein